LKKTGSPASLLADLFDKKPSKYRSQLKDVNYYNNLPNILKKSNQRRVNLGKNLIMNLLKITNTED
jgi:hypothetical protein